MGKIVSHICAITLLCGVGFAGCASAQPQKGLDESIRAAQDVLVKFQGDPAMNVLRGKLKEAKAILILSPGIDRGLALAYNRSAQTWSVPAFYRVTRVEAGRGAGGAGFSAGKQDVELIALAMTDKALDWLKSPKLPGTGGMVVRPITASSSSRERSNADVLLFSRKNAVSGAKHLDELFITIDKTGNESYYGRTLTPAEIFSMQNTPSADATSLQKAVMAAAAAQ